MFYLFTFVERSLQVYVTSDLLSDPLKQHPKSPVVSGNITARPAGRVFVYDNELYRTAQDSHRYYGEKVHLLKSLNYRH
jgi:hypothetical protein